ncbi:MAG: hypothetical protein JWO06_2330 [Bacteroidota bacterium]|nr:hypothetical protein [Bacteroidota bacterium]
MKAIQVITKILFTIFLVICISVHVYGLIAPFSTEPVWSHIVHTISYCACLFTLLVSVKYRLGIYIVGACYPFIYHANCAWHSYADLGKLNPICLLVVVMMPLAAVFIWNMEKR